MRLPTAYGALRSSGYRRVLLEQLLFETSLTVFEVALFWDVVQNTGRSSAVGLLFALIVLPAAVMAAPVGRQVDRLGARPLIVLASTAGATVLAAAAVAARLDAVNVPVAIVLATSAGVSMGLWAVPCQVTVSRVVPSDVRSGAIALSLAPSGLSAMIGGALAGWLLQISGSVAVFVLGAIGMLVAAGVAVALPKVKVSLDLVHAERSFWRTVGWIRQQRLIAILCALAVIASICVVGRVVLYPALVEDVLDAGPEKLGLLVSATGIGSLVAALTAETTATWLGRGAAAMSTLAAAAVFLIGLGFSHHAWLSAFLAFACATAAVTYQASAAMVVHLSAHPDDRGRVVGVYDISRLSLVPAGTILLGFLADQIGPAATCLLMGAITLTASLGLRMFARHALADEPGRIDGQQLRL